MKKISLFFFAFLAALPLAAQDAFFYEEQGWTYFNEGNPEAAIDSFTKSIELDPEFETPYYGRGSVCLKMGEYDKAIGDFSRAIEKYGNYTRAWNGLGMAYYYKGDYDAAITNYARAIELDGKDAEVYVNLGEAYRGKGEYGLAVENCTEAIGLDKNSLNAWNNRGIAYINTGEYDKAIADLDQVIKIKQDYALAWTNRGSAYLEKHNYSRAIENFSEAIRLDPGSFDAFSGRARAYRSGREYQKALADCESALALNGHFTPALNIQGLVYRDMGDNVRALECFQKSLDEVAGAVNRNEISVYAWYLANQIYTQYPYLEGSIKNNPYWSRFAGLVLDGIDRGVGRAEDLRLNLGVRGAELMKAMLYLYYAGVDFEANFGKEGKAFEYSESLRSRSFLEQMGAEAAIRLDGVSVEERREFLSLSADITEQKNTIAAFEKVKLEGETLLRYNAAVQRLENTEKELGLLDEAIGGRVPKYRELRNPRPVTVSQAQSFCGDDRIVLEYVLWDNSGYKPVKGYESWSIPGSPPAINSYCLIITKDGVTPVQLDSGFNYKRTVETFRMWMSVKHGYQQAECESARNDLYAKLIEPVLPKIPSNIKNILIVPDGELAYIPFDLLRKDKWSRDFGESYVLSLSPSVSVSVFAQKEGDTLNMPILAFANAVYNREDKNFMGGQRAYNEIWDNLPGTANEAAILREVADRQNKDITVYQGEEVTEEWIKKLSGDAELKKYPIIHFACHGYFDETEPEKSAIVLSEVSDARKADQENNGYLTIKEIAALSLDAWMTLLSACETGLGKTSRGDGMTGIARAFLVAGSENVGVSLWRIDDDATGLFMGELYRKVLEEEKSFREAYHEVKNDFRNGKHGRIYDKPFYWAAFTMYE